MAQSQSAHSRRSVHGNGSRRGRDVLDCWLRDVFFVEMRLRSNLSWRALVASGMMEGEAKLGNGQASSPWGAVITGH